MGQKSREQSNQKENENNITKSKKRNNTAIEPSLRRSTRISNKLKGCKNITIIESSGNKSTRVSKKRRIASLMELNAKLTLPATNPEVDFPGLTDVDREPFP